MSVEKAWLNWPESRVGRSPMGEVDGVEGEYLVSDV
jgi:hypothetical protein